MPKREIAGAHLRFLCTKHNHLFYADKVLKCFEEVEVDCLYNRVKKTINISSFGRYSAANVETRDRKLFQLNKCQQNVENGAKIQIKASALFN